MQETIELWQIDFSDCPDPKAAIAAYLESIVGTGIGTEEDGDVELWAADEGDGKVTASAHAEESSDKLYSLAVNRLIEGEIEAREAMGCPLSKETPPPTNEAGVAVAAWMMLSGARRLLRSLKVPELAELWRQIGWERIRSDLTRAAAAARHISQSVNAYRDWKYAGDSGKSKNGLWEVLKKMVENWR